jgi:hypothetical protein
MIKLGGIVNLNGMKFEQGKVYSNPYAKSFAPQIKEEEGSQDHEVSMAQNSLDSIIKSATELKAKMGEVEKQIPAWIQDHITNADNFISQAASNYHEYGDSNENVNEAGINKMYVKYLAVQKKVRELEDAQKLMAQKYFAETDPKKKDQLMVMLKKGTATLQAFRRNLADIEEKYITNLDSDAEYKGESVNEADLNWNAVQNAIINFLKANTKILDKRVQAKDTDGVKSGLKSIISGLTNAQRSLKLESVNEASYVNGYTVKAKTPYEFVNGAYAVLSAYLRDEQIGPKGKRELQNILKSLDYMRKYFFFKLDESIKEAKKYDIGSGYMGNGLTIWNRAEQQNGDYKIIAHISPQGKLSVRDNQLPGDLKKMFQIWADSMAKGNMGPKY